MADLRGDRGALGVDRVGERRAGPAPTSGLSSTIWCPSVVPARVTAQYATVVMPTPPAANRRWNSMSSGVTTRLGVRPSNVAALMMRLRSVTGPSRAGANGSSSAMSATYFQAG